MNNSPSPKIDTFYENSRNLKMPILDQKNRENTIENMHAKDWHIFQVLSTQKMCQSLAKDRTWIFWNSMQFEIHGNVI